jgi:hypothetical protein
MSGVGDDAATTPFRLGEPVFDFEEHCETKDGRVQQAGPFEATWFNWMHNKWEIKSEADYEILMCSAPDPETVLETHSIKSKHVAVIHKKARGCK